MRTPIVWRDELWDVASNVVNRLAVCFSLITFAGCAGNGAYVWVDDLPDNSPARHIQMGDRISVQVKDQIALSGEFLVRANGAYLQPVLGEVEVSGMATEQAAQHLAKRLKGVVVNPAVSVSISTPRALRVTVIGEVRTPGRFELPAAEGVLTALARAGGLTEFADRSGIYVLRNNPGRARIRFSFTALTNGDAKATAFMLRDGDVVVVK